MKNKYKVYVDCANCANLMEDRASKVEGVKSCAMNFMAQKLAVEFEDGVNEDVVLENIIKECKKVDSDFELTK